MVYDSFGGVQYFLNNASNSLGTSPEQKMMYWDTVPSAVHFGARLLLALLPATFATGQGGAAINERYERSPSVPLMRG